MTDSQTSFSHQFRWRAIRIIALIPVLAISVRLWQLQVSGHEAYAYIAAQQSLVQSTLDSDRGEIYATERDGRGGERLVPLAVNRSAVTVYSDPRSIVDPTSVAQLLAERLGLDEADTISKLSKSDDPYEELIKRGGPEVKAVIEELDLKGIGMTDNSFRFYPNNNLGSHILGFVQYQDDKMVGQYGTEGYLDAMLSGQSGYFSGEINATGSLLGVGDRLLDPAIHGSDVVLTIDWTLQYHTCKELNSWVAQHGASGGSVIIMDPNTGFILAMCSSPDYNPNVFNEVGSINKFNNPAIFDTYEPGSVVKPLTMSAAIDQQKVTPSTTYIDTGEVVFGQHTIRNSDLKSNGEQSMTEVLVKSLNTGVVFLAQQLGGQMLKDYFEDFGLGAKTNIELEGEANGNIKQLDEKQEIYYATASFGQGITATPLQMVTAYSALANGGELFRPHIVRELLHKDGTTTKTKPTNIGKPISQKTAALVSGMLVEVVERGHGKKAGVPGYFIAGKTGTAQIPRKDGQGYETGVGSTIGSFVGFGPVSDPKFAMIVRVDRPRDVQFAESSAAPLFGELAKFFLQYYEIPPDRI
jgi:cell division protein FtsI/penicillin-binding protein 2